MITAVVPAQNEENRIFILLNRLLKIGEINSICVILNGSTDRTKEQLKKYGRRLQVLEFPESLGIDVPRAIGAFWALLRETQYILFVDGDLIGEITGGLRVLIYNSLQQKLDLAITNCYPQQQETMPTAIKYFRRMLNNKIGRPDLGVATPSHGPSLVSRRLFIDVPLRELCIPPVSLALAEKAGRRVDIGTTIPHFLLGSSLKNSHHNQMIKETIIGDTLEGIAAYTGGTRHRWHDNKRYLGYHLSRRFDILEDYMFSLKNKKPPSFGATWYTYRPL